MTGFELLALLIPVAAGLILWYYFPDRVTWWEACLPLLPVLLAVPLLRWTVEGALTSARERIGGWVVEAAYYEDWDEYIHQTCSRTVSCGKDCTRTEFYDCSYVAYHPPEWIVTDSNGTNTAISAEEYAWLKSRFHNEVFTDLHRHYHSDDGDKYSVRWPGSDPTFTPFTVVRTYEHRPKAARGVFHYEEVKNPDKVGVHRWPPLSSHFEDPAVLGSCKGSLEADRRLQRLNAKLGASKQVHVWVLLFQDKDREIAEAQEALWVGANNNEFVVAIGMRGDTPTWVHPFCWSPDGDATNDTLKIRVRDFVMLKPSGFDIVKLADFLEKEVAQHWRRKPRRELAYLQIELPTWAGVLCMSVSILICCGVGYYAVQNDFDRDDPFRRRTYRPFGRRSF